MKIAENTFDVSCSLICTICAMCVCIFNVCSPSVQSRLWYQRYYTDTKGQCTFSLIEAMVHIAAILNAWYIRTTTGWSKHAPSQSAMCVYIYTAECTQLTTHCEEAESESDKKHLFKYVCHARGYFKCQSPDDAAIPIPKVQRLLLV